MRSFTIMKITQILYTYSFSGLSCRGEERFLPYGEGICLAGRPVPTARLWKKLKANPVVTFPDQTGDMTGQCHLTEESFTPRKAEYTLHRTDNIETKKIATVIIEQFSRPTAIKGHKVRGRIAVTDTTAPSDTAEALKLAGVLDTAGQIALGLGLIRLVYNDTPPVFDDEATSLRDELTQTKAAFQALQENYDGYVKTLEQSLQEWEARCPQEDLEQGAFPLPDDYTARLEKATDTFTVCVAGGNDLWHEKIRTRFPDWTILENKNFDGQKLQGADILIINTNHTGHALVRKACQQAASQGTMVCYTSRYNLNAVAADILYALGE